MLRGILMCVSEGGWRERQRERERDYEQNSVFVMQNKVPRSRAGI